MIKRKKASVFRGGKYERVEVNIRRKWSIFLSQTERLKLEIMSEKRD